MGGEVFLLFFFLCGCRFAVVQREIHAVIIGTVNGRRLFSWSCVEGIKFAFGCLLAV